MHPDLARAGAVERGAERGRRDGGAVREDIDTVNSLAARDDYNASELRAGIPLRYVGAAAEYEFVSFKPKSAIHW